MLDLATLLIISGVLAVLLVTAISYTMDVAAPRSRASLRVWQGALACNALFWLLYVGDFKFFPGILPHWLAVMVINGASLAATLGYVWAFRLFLHLPPRRRLLSGVLLASLVANLFMSTFVDDYRLRLLFNLGTIAAMMIWLATSLWRCRESGVIRAARMSMLVFVIGSAAILSRLYDLFTGFVTSVDAAVFGQTAALLGFALVPCFGTLGFLLMHVGRASHYLERLADTDPLTGAHNRRALESIGRRVLSAARRHKEPVSLLMIDADHFKAINDRYGHEAGDAALLSMMQTISRSLREEDIVGRIGGEEFVVILPNADADGAMEVAERVRTAMQGTVIDPDRLPLSLTVSVGITTTDTAEENLDELIRRADLGLYEAKARGRNLSIHQKELKPQLTPVA